MDPAFIDTNIWHDLSTMLRLLWVSVVLVFGIAFNFLVAHAIIPSLADSRQLPTRIVRLRPVFYLAAAGFLVFAVVFIILTAIQIDVVADVWDRWGI